LLPRCRSRCQLSLASGQLIWRPRSSFVGPLVCDCACRWMIARLSGAKCIPSMCRILKSDAAFRIQHTGVKSGARKGRVFPGSWLLLRFESFRRFDANAARPHCRRLRRVQRTILFIIGRAGRIHPLPILASARAQFGVAGKRLGVCAVFMQYGDATMCSESAGTSRSI